MFGPIHDRNTIAALLDLSPDDISTEAPNAISEQPTRAEPFGFARSVGVTLELIEDGQAAIHRISNAIAEGANRDES